MTSCQSVGNTYYISASTGDDAADGLSVESAWKSFANVKPLRLTAGDRVLLRRSDEWNETLYVHANGAENNWVLVSYYGDENDPTPIPNPPQKETPDEQRLPQSQVPDPDAHIHLRRPFRLHL